MKIFETLASRARLALLAAVASIAALSAGLVATTPLPLAAGVAAGVALTAPTNADAAISIATATRNARCTAIVTAAGSGAKAKLYSGTRPANANTTASGTLLATIIFSTTIGTCTSGSLDFDEAGATQTNSSHVSGTPGYVRIETSAAAAVLDIDVCGSAPCWAFTGSVATGQNVTLDMLSLTEAP